MKFTFAEFNERRRTPLSRAIVLLLLSAGVGYAIGTALAPLVL